MSKYQGCFMCAEKLNGFISWLYKAQLLRNEYPGNCGIMLLVLPILNHMNSVRSVTHNFFNSRLNLFPFTYNTVCACMLFPRHSLGAILFSILICFTVSRLSYTLLFFQFLWMFIDGRKLYFSVLDWLRKKLRGLRILVNFCNVGSG